MQTRSGAEITVYGDVVHKLHRPGTDPHALSARLRAARRLEVVLTPLSERPEPVGDRWRSRWPEVETLAAQPESVPWADIAQVLARLHTSALPERLPAHGWPARLRRAIPRTRRPGGEVIRRAAAALPAQAWRAGSADRPRTLVHGDFHLGQLGRRDPAGPWALIDIDDLGVGDPAWDLARPAGFWAAGLIPDEDWELFLDAYRAAGGPALPLPDPWPVLEPFARAAVIQAAANTPDDDLLVAACARMPQLEKNSRPKPCLR
ncbi:aminoglycoside phosphotransferase family protein [Mycobacterium sp. 21AC1]|uniref:phosphotransferase family protein n=1 Tax=[Mycobacterium] appelbergii TaxID=2939269 RepID=UPI00293933E6|nr:aminoglycoside phosphotransferase family protein [Mycobacterium sp. 21AC1]MDV3123862.1 aminoglycoside phosphotransferase family protein [Mycobacterium sp. 21AC1]